MDINSYSYTAPDFWDESPPTKAPPATDARTYALRLAYAIPGYRTASRETKNYVYDQIINTIRRAGGRKLRTPGLKARGLKES